jgi:hypothetical protein
LAAGNFSDYRRICTFRKRHLEDFKRLFLEVLKLCQKVGLVKLNTVAIDGTKFKANASKHRAMSYGRMKQEEACLEAEIERLMAKARTTDDLEDRRYGDRRDDLPEELRFHQSRLAKLREAKRALEDEAKESSSSKQDDDDDDSLNGDPPSDGVDWGKPDDKVQRNFTDPDSRIMKAPGKHQVMRDYKSRLMPRLSLSWLHTFISHYRILAAL